MKDDYKGADFIFDGFRHYFRTSQFAHVYVRQEFDSGRFFSETRKSYLELSGDEEELASLVHPIDDQTSLFEYQHTGYDFSISLRLSPFEFDKASSGNIEVSNQGIYITDLDTSEILPNALGMLGGTLDLKSGIIDLAASRSDIVRNQKLELLREQITSLISTIFAQLVSDIASAAVETLDESDVELKERNDRFRRLKYFLVSCYRDGDQLVKNAVTANLNSYPILVSSKHMPLSSVETSAANVFLLGKNYRLVSEAFTYDTKSYFVHVPSEVEFKEQALSSNRHSMVEYLNFQEGWRYLSEKDMIADWFKRRGVNPVDIVNEDPQEARLRSLPIPAHLREYLGKNVKLVQTGNETRLAWRTEDELWINISNRSMQSLYSSLRSGNLPDEDKVLVKILADVLSLKLDDAVNKLVATIATGRN